METDHYSECRLKLPVTRPFVQQFSRAIIQENIKFLHHWSFGSTGVDSLHESQ